MNKCVFSLNLFNTHTWFRYDDPHKVIGVVKQYLHFLMHESVNYADMWKLANRDRALLHVDDLKGQTSMLKV